jgi:hypothetical protein
MARFDADGDSALSVAELQAFARAVNQGREFEEDELEQITEYFKCDDEGRLTPQGFEQMYHMQTVRARLGWLSALAFSIVTRFCMALLNGCAGRLTAENGGFRSGQSARPADSWKDLRSLGVDLETLALPVAAAAGQLSDILADIADLRGQVMTSSRDLMSPSHLIPSHRGTARAGHGHGSHPEGARPSAHGPRRPLPTAYM